MGQIRTLRRASQLRSLEQRFMFDGAAVATAADAAHPQADAATLASMAKATAPAAVQEADPSLHGGRKEVVFVDTSVSGYKTLEAAVQAGVEIQEIDHGQSGLAQMAAWASSHADYDAVHILGHGSEATLYVGSDALTLQSMATPGVQAELAALGHALKAGADVLVYGCDVGKGADGAQWTALLSQCTGMDVAASNDDTGAASAHGNWVLEQRHGKIDTNLPFDRAAIASYSGLLTTFDLTGASGSSTQTVQQTVGSDTMVVTATDDVFVVDTDTNVWGGGIANTSGIVMAVASGVGYESNVRITVSGGKVFDLSSFTLVDIAGENKDLTITTNKGTQTLTSAFSSLSWSVSLSGATFTGVSYADITTSHVSNHFAWGFDNFVLNNITTPPTVTDAKISITSSGTGTGGAYKINDTVTASWNNTAGGDNNAGITGVTMDFSAFGGGSAVTASNSSGTWTASYVIAGGSVDGVNKNVSVTASNGASATTADTTNLTVDNIAPTVSDARLSISGASGTGGAYKVGDTVTATWNNTAGGDNNSDTISSVTVDFSAFGGGSAVSASNSSGTWTATYTIVAGAIDGANKNVSFTATDNAGNTTTTADTTNATLDNVAPTVTDANISISGASGTGGTYKIGDTVTATWNNTAGGDNNSDTISSVTVDFSAFGGGAAVAASNSSGTWTATYTIVGGAIDGTNKNVSVTATDNAGNATTRADTTNATADNVAPTVSDARISISGASGTGGAYKIGDTVTATWNNTAGGDNNSDTISSVTVDFSAFGGGAAVAASNSSGTWTATYTIVSGAIDGTNKNVSVTATDNAGNTTTTADTTNATLDNVAPTVSDARISISGASGTGGAYKIGDTVTATWNNTAGGDNNSDTISSVTVDFSAFGGGSAVAASNSSGTWTATYTIVAGAIDGTNKNVSVSATDNAGNTTTTADTTNATLDNVAPTVTDANISISGASGTAGAYKIGDTVTATWNNTAGGDNNSDTISSVTVDFSAFGGGAAVAASNSSGTWTATYTIVGGAIDGTNKNVSVTATDNAGNTTTTADTTNATADNVAPTVSDARISISGASGTGGAYKVGDTVTATWNNTAGGDNNSDTMSSVTVDFSQFGGGSAVSASNSSGTWTGTYTIVSGAINGTTNRNVSVTATDNAGNTTTTADTTNATVDNAAPTITIATAAFSSDTGASSTDFITSAASQTISGTLSANVASGDAVLVSLDNGATWSTATTTIGQSTWSLSGQTLSASNTLKVKLQDGAGNDGTAYSQAYTLDTSTPSAPSTPDMSTGSDSGASSSDDLTSNATPTFTGTAESGSTVRLYDTDGTTVVGTGTATGGNWSITASTLSDATHTITAKAIDAAGNTSSASSGLSVTVDTTAQTVASVVVPGNGSYKAGTNLDFTVNFDGAITVDTTGGTPRMALTIGTTTVYAPYQSGSGSAALTFRYSVQTGENDVDGIAVGALQLNGGTISDTAGNNATLTLNSVGSTASVLVDTTAPTITFSAVALSNDTGASSTDFITSAASQTVSAALSVAPAGGDVVYGSLDNGATWTDITNKVSGSTLTWNGVTLASSNTLSLKVTDAAGNDGTAFSQAYVLDAATPSAPSTPDMATGSDLGSSSSDNNTSNATPTFTGTAESGSTVTLYDTDGTTALGTATATGGNWSITASALSDGAHTVTAKSTDTAGNTSAASSSLALSIDTSTPTGLALNTTTIPTTTATATSTIATLSGTDSQAITYTLAAGNGTNDADNGSFTVTGASLKVGGASLTAGTYHVYVAATDVAGNAAYQAFTLNVVDAPSVASVVRAGAASSTVNTAATSVDYTVTFDQSVSGVDAGDFAVTSTGTASGSVASLAIVSGTTYTVTVNTLSGDGTLRLDILGSGTGIQNGSSVAIMSGYTSGQTYTLDHTVPSATSTPDMTTGSDTGISSTDNITSNATPTFTGTAESGSTVTLYDTDGSTVLGTGTATGGNWSIASSTLSGGAHTVTAKAADAAGNTSAASSGLAVTIDGAAPTVASVSVPSAGNYKAGDNLSFTVNGNEAITVNTGGGTPRLALTIGGSTAYAGYASGSGTTALVFTYAVQAGDTDVDGISVGALQANGGTLTDAAGNNMTLTLNSVGSTASVLVDTTAPAVTAVSVPSNGTFYDGDNLDFTVQFDEAVTVDTSGGTPGIALTIGATPVQANYLSGSGSSALVFRYTVPSGQLDADGISIGALNVNGGTLRDAATNNAATTLNSVGSTAAVLVDSVVPSVTDVTSTTANGSYKAGDAINVTVTFSKAVNVSTAGGTPTITLNDGASASYSSGSGSSALVFSYIVGTSQDTADLDYSATNALAFNGGTVTEVTGAHQSAVLTLAAPGAAHSLGANKAIVIDTTPPSATFSGLALSNDTGTSSTDFITTTSAQTITATLSATPAGSDVVYGSLDNGATWVDITNKVSGTTLSWTGVTLTASSTLMLKVTDGVGNDGTVASQAYVLDASAPAITFSSLALSSDTGSSGTDFITKTAAQTLTATLSGTIAGSDIVEGSLDNGATWTDITSKVSGTSLTWDGITLTGSSTLQLKVTDSAGNDGAVASQAYVLDTSAPSITFSGLALSNDTGTSSTDFITKTAAQTIIATLSATPAGTDVVYGSLDNGATWTNITSKVSGTTLTWDDVALTASSTLKLKVSDQAGNDGPVASQAYVYDSTAPALPTFNNLTTTSITPTLTGAATLGEGDTMALTINGGATYNVTPSSGPWSLDLATATPVSGTLALAAGRTFAVTVVVTDTAGNTATVTGELNIAVPAPIIQPAPFPVAEPPSPPPPPPPLPAPPPVAVPTFLSLGAQATVLPTVASGDARAVLSGTSAPSTSPPVSRPAPAPAPAPTSTESTPGMTRGGEGRFQVTVVPSSNAGGAEGLMLNRGMTDQVISASGRATITIPADAFASTNPNAAIQLSAQQANGRPLPNWVSFDAAKGQFVVQAPPGVTGELAIKVVARDAQGHEVVSVFKIKVGGQRPGQTGRDDGHKGRPGLSEQVRMASKPSRAVERSSGKLPTDIRGKPVRTV